MERRPIIIGSLGHIKYWKRDKKFYAAIVAKITRPRYLRRHQRTATAADEYGKAVATRYQRWQATSAQLGPEQFSAAAFVAMSAERIGTQDQDQAKAAQEPAIAAIVDQDKSQP